MGMAVHWDGESVAVVSSVGLPSFSANTKRLLFRMKAFCAVTPANVEESSASVVQVKFSEYV